MLLAFLLWFAVRVRDAHPILSFQLAEAFFENLAALDYGSTTATMPTLVAWIHRRKTYRLSRCRRVGLSIHLYRSILIVLKREQLPAMKRTHLFTCLALLPPILCVGVLNYVMPSFGFYRLWIYHVWILAFVVPFFVFTFFKYGFLGIRLLIERRKLDSTLRAITSGTAILNHAIKNDVGKMRLFLEKMQQHALETQQTELIRTSRSS